jgi:hypothetical protein
MVLYAATIFLGAFLLFLVQPIMAKQILPWFGGSAAVWATCMVFFQVTLLAGYAYADWTTRRMSPRTQAKLHIGLLVASLALMPIIPDASWKPTGEENPSVRILAMLAVAIGLPYLMLASTSPLIQAWFARRYAGTLPYRLFALSNVASLAALLAYPVTVEPWITTRAQSIGWSTAYALFVILCIAAGISALRHGSPGPASNADAARAEAASTDAAAVPPSWSTRGLWLALAATGSFMLVAVTNHICQNVASIPFLWILPLTLYLATFVLAFDHPRWYLRRFFIAATALALPAMALMFDSLELDRAVPLYLGGLFAICMFCHGEFARLKPTPTFLTTYYLMLSLGGALGGLLVGLVAPYVLSGHFEMLIGLVACGVLLLVLTRSRGLWASGIAVAVIGSTAWWSYTQVEEQVSHSRVMLRNFYSAIRTRDSQFPVPFRSLVHGGIMHGGQLLEPDLKMHASSYFGPDSGFGRLFDALPDERRRVGVIGLGAGSITAHARAGDFFRFYEINPQVVDLAYSEFTFLTATQAKTEVVLGDGRLSMEREAPQQYDVIAVDAFSGDAIPMHLITREAFRIYLKHLKPDGVIAFQATNRFVDIAPVVERLASEHAMKAAMISDHPQSSDGPAYWLSGTDQILVTRNTDLLNHDRIRGAAQAIEQRADLPVWTDDFNNLLRVLKP